MLPKVGKPNQCPILKFLKWITFPLFGNVPVNFLCIDKLAWDRPSHACYWQILFHTWCHINYMANLNILIFAQFMYGWEIEAWTACMTSYLIVLSGLGIRFNSHAACIDDIRAVITIRPVISLTAFNFLSFTNYMVLYCNNTANWGN